FRPHRLTCTALNPVFLARLRERLERHGLAAEILEDDIERTALAPGPDLLLSTLLLEHIAWLHGVEAFARVRPTNMRHRSTGESAGHEGGRHARPGLPPSIARAVETAHPTLVPRDDLIVAMTERGYPCRETEVREVADGKRPVGLLFGRT